jgi:hypothetical protein
MPQARDEWPSRTATLYARVTYDGNARSCAGRFIVDVGQMARLIRGCSKKTT